MNEGFTLGPWRNWWCWVRSVSDATWMVGVAELVDFGRNWGRTGGRDALFGKVDGSWVGNGASRVGPAV